MLQLKMRKKNSSKKEEDQFTSITQEIILNVLVGDGEIIDSAAHGSGGPLAMSLMVWGTSPACRLYMV